MKRAPVKIQTPGVLVLAQGKGGVGKSALATSLAGYYARGGLKTALIDADPQATIAKRHDADGPMGVVTVIAAPGADAVANAIEQQRQTHDVVIVDTAGFKNQTTIMALVQADVALIPSRAAHDNLSEAIAMLEQARAIERLPDRRGRPLLAALVLTHVKKNTVIARTARRTLRKHGLPLLNAEMLDRVYYAEASGLSPCLDPTNPAAARDIDAIGRELGKDAPCPRSPSSLKPCSTA